MSSTPASHAEVRATGARLWRLFDDVMPALDALADRPLGVITSGTDLQQRGKLERMGIADRFAVILTSEQVGVGNPDPRIFVEAASRLAASARDCVHVGDDWERDVQGARAGEFRPVWLDRRHHAEWITSSDADVSRITTLVELVRLIERE